jgi:hypothetical protein
MLASCVKLGKYLLQKEYWQWPLSLVEKGERAIPQPIKMNSRSYNMYAAFISWSCTTSRTEGVNPAYPRRPRSTNFRGCQDM